MIDESRPDTMPPKAQGFARIRGLCDHLFVLLLALGLAVWAQTLVDKRASLDVALAAYLGAALLFVLSTRTVSGERIMALRSSNLSINGAYLRWSLLFAALGFLSFHGNRITSHALIPWGIGVLLCFVALPVGPAKDAADERMSVGARLRAALKAGRWCVPWTTWALILAVLVGAFLRFYHLLEIPADLGWDLPYNYTDAQRVLEGSHLVFFPDNFGREGMFFYLIAAVSKLGTLSAYSIRITSALIGVAAIPAIYALASECADRETGAYAAFLLAINKWHMTLTRSGYRVSLMPLFTILALYGLARALRRGRSRDWAWAGFFLGLGLWTYKAFTFVLFTAIGCAFLYALLSHFRRGGRGEASGVDPASGRWVRPTGTMLRGLALMLLMTIIVATPMIRFVVDSPDAYMARELHGAKLVSESLDSAHVSWLKLYGRNLATSLLMFNYEGDGNSRFGVPYQRHLGLISGMLFVLAVAGAISRFRRGGNALLLFSVSCLLLPMTVSMLAGEKPNCFRASGVIGPSLVLAAIVLRTVRGKVSQSVAGLGPRKIRLQLSTGVGNTPSTHTLRFGLNLALLPLLLVASLLLAETRETWQLYFHDFRRVAPDRANYSIALELANAIIDFQDGPTFIKVWPHWYDGRAVNEHLGAAGRTLTAEVFDLKAGIPPMTGARGKVLVLLHPRDEASLSMLKTYFARWAVRTAHYLEGDPSYIAFYGEK